MNQTEPRKILILGAGGHAHVAADCLSLGKNNQRRFELIGFLDDNPQLAGKSVLGKPILGALKDLDAIPHDNIFIAIGNNQTRSSLFQSLGDKHESLITIVHPKSVIATDVEIGLGVLVAPGVIINPGTKIGHNVILNTGTTIDHHNQIGDHVHIAPGVHIGGEVSIGDGSLVGIGAVILPQCSVGSWSVVGAGAVLTKSIGDRVMVAGVPAKPINADSEKDGK